MLEWLKVTNYIIIVFLGLGNMCIDTTHNFYPCKMQGYGHEYVIGGHFEFINMQIYANTVYYND